MVIKAKYIILLILNGLFFGISAKLQRTDIARIVHEVSPQGVFAKETFSGMDYSGAHRITAIQTSYNPNSIQVLIGGQLLNSQREKKDWYNFLKSKYLKSSTPEGRADNFDEVDVI